MTLTDYRSQLLDVVAQTMPVRRLEVADLAGITAPQADSRLWSAYVAGLVDRTSDGWVLSWRGACVYLDLESSRPAARCGDLTSPGKVGVSDERRDAGAAARTVSSWSDPRVDNVRLTARYREDGRAAATNQPGDTP